MVTDGPPAFVPLPEGLLDLVAAKPDEVGTWQVVSDWMLETGHPLASLARCELELLKGISNLDLLGELAAARRAHLGPGSRWAGTYGLTWRCGLVIRADLGVRAAEALLDAPELEGLHAFGLTIVGAEDFRWSGELTTLRLALDKLPRRVREVDFRSGGFEASLLGEALRLVGRRPREGRVLRLSLGAFSAHRVLALFPYFVEQGWRVLDLDGTTISGALAGSLQRALDAVPEGVTVALGGTGLDASQVASPRVTWLRDDAPAWWESVERGTLVPVWRTGPRAVGLLPRLCRAARHELTGWTLGLSRPLSDGEVVEDEGEAWRFRAR